MTIDSCYALFEAKQLSMATFFDIFVCGPLQSFVVNVCNKKNIVHRQGAKDIKCAQHLNLFSFAAFHNKSS